MNTAPHAFACTITHGWFLRLNGMVLPTYWPLPRPIVCLSSVKMQKNLRQDNWLMLYLLNKGACEKSTNPRIPLFYGEREEIPLIRGNKSVSLNKGGLFVLDRYRFSKGRYRRNLNPASRRLQSAQTKAMRLPA